MTDEILNLQVQQDSYTIDVTTQPPCTIDVMNVGLTGPPGADGDASIQEAEFIVATNNQTNFNIMAAAVQLVAVSINGVDATQYFAINPPGSGIVVYTPTEYATEIGDFIRIVYV